MVHSNQVVHSSTSMVQTTAAAAVVVHMCAKGASGVERRARALGEIRHSLAGETQPRWKGGAVPVGEGE